MRTPKTFPTPMAIVALALGATGWAQAEDIIPIDLATIQLGAKIVGPVGPEVEVTFINEADSDEGVGDLTSSVSCPDEFTECIPPNNTAGTIYTYVHTAIPGVDLPNDPPFPSPLQTVPFDNVTQFDLGFEAAGFKGVAGYSFDEAALALGATDLITIEHRDDGSLVWTIDSDDWDTGESITFFWQTTQPPSGPGGVYSISDRLVTGTGAGPLPTQVVIPEPASAAVIGCLALGALICQRRG